MAETSQPEPAGKRSRVLACARCHRRKIKCNRTFPCLNCTEIGATCVETAPRKRERSHRLPHRDLVQRLQRYETLLRQNDIAFESSHQYIAAVTPSGRETGDLESSSPVLLREEGGGSKPSEKLNIWEASDETNRLVGGARNATKTTDEPDFSSGNFTNDQAMQKALNHLNGDKNEHLLFFAPNPVLNITAQHPTPSHIFKLWQVYQDNIDPLLKVTHIPSLQSRITDAIGSMDKIDAALEALLFGIYSVALISLTDGECSNTFGSTYTRTDLIDKYQIACQQALIRCGYLRSDDRDCLTALYLYVTSIKPRVDRRSLCSILGSVFRIAQRMEIHNETRNAKNGIFEAEMRRRLWWSLVIFDAHVCEMSNNLQSANLIPTWDCKPPSNINDFELRLDMKSRLPTSSVPTQALYVHVRSIITQYLRHSDFQLAFINPTLSLLGNRVQTDALMAAGDEITILEKILNIDLSPHLDHDNPIHSMTIWTTRAQIAKAHLLKHYWTSSRSKPSQQTPADLDTATSHAIRILECEAQLTSLPHLHRFLWHISRFYFPAYIHILKDLQSRPKQPCAERAWKVMSENFRARIEENPKRDNPVMMLFANLVLRAWEARESAEAETGERLQSPGIVKDVRRFVLPGDEAGLDKAVPMFEMGMEFDLDGFLPVPLEFSNLYSLDGGLPDLGLFGKDFSRLETRL